MPRRRQGKGIDHDGTIIIAAADLMWGGDGTCVQTAEEGMCWIFTVVDHFSFAVVGPHVRKGGTASPLCSWLRRASAGSLAA